MKNIIIIILYKDKPYVYSGHDADSATYFEMPDYQLFSTSDMKKLGKSWYNFIGRRF